MKICIDQQVNFNNSVSYNFSSNQVNPNQYGFMTQKSWISPQLSHSLYPGATSDDVTYWVPIIDSIYQNGPKIHNPSAMQKLPSDDIDKKGPKVSFAIYFQKAIFINFTFWILFANFILKIKIKEGGEHLKSKPSKFSTDDLIESKSEKKDCKFNFPDGGWVCSMCK